jgi:hypothetical protein
VFPISITSLLCGLVVDACLTATRTTTTNYLESCLEYPSQFLRAVRPYLKSKSMPPRTRSRRLSSSDGGLLGVLGTIDAGNNSNNKKNVKDTE